MPPIKKRPPPVPHESELAELFSDFPNIDVLERRLLDPTGPSSLPIRLIDEPGVAIDPTGKKRKWYLRWVNSTMPGRFHTLSTAMGYVPVTWDEIANKEQIADRYESPSPNPDRTVRRGDQGKDVLMKIPYVYYLRIKKRQQDLADARNSPKSIKDQLQQEAALRLGPEAAEGVGQMIGEVKELPADALLDVD